MPEQPPRKPQQTHQQQPQSMDEYRYIQQLYQNQYMAIAQELNTSIDTLRELDNVQKTLENIDSIEGKETLIPIGSDTYLDGKITNAKSLILGIGAGYLVEKDIDNAKKHIAKAIEKETQNINKLNRTKKEIEAALIEIGYQVEQMTHQV